MRINGAGADSSTPPSLRSGSARNDTPEQRLRETARSLNAVFVQQLFTAMRNTVDTQGGIVSGGQGEEMFRGILDQHVAEMAPKQWEKNDALTEAIVRQLGRNLK
jgi:peptidoglycan hydrolase FlgJ